MLTDHDAIATVAVKDLEVARKFYQDVVGLTPTEKQEPGAASFKSGGSTLFVYVSQYAGTNQATAVTWVVGDEVEEIVRTLKARGVVFEHYDLPDVTLHGDIHVAGGSKLAWFKDPDGNILAIAGR
jgi:catechol 2,3-dioxygenase-like lactoylglutathione lyase family enzyme